MNIHQAKDSVAIQAALPLIAAYWQFEKIDHFDSQRIAALLQQLIDHPEHGSLWLATNDKHCVGYLLLTYQFSLEYGGMAAEIDELFVTESARALGTGKALLQSAENHLRENRFVKWQLQIAHENLPALQFYRKHGFTERLGFQLLDKTL